MSTEDAINHPTPPKGGGFLVTETTAQHIHTPEEWNEEQRMIAKTCDDFLEQEVHPNLDKIDDIKNNPEIVPAILDKAGKLGLLGTSIPAAYGGMDLDFNTTMLVTERIGAGSSLAVAISAHTGIGTLPILYYGNEEQKKKYIPKLATGEWKAAYCLTEPDSGSDANSGKTKAILSQDEKNYIIQGQKMWITNGGFADIFIVFAKIEDDRNLSAFILQKETQGISMNEEENKMGIKGSSTRQIFFNDCIVPVENLLGLRGRGFKIAVNILNIGRIKLGIAALGAAKKVTAHSIIYATERKQFGVPIANFGAIQHKLAVMVIKIYASEAAHYRASNDLDNWYKMKIKEGEKPSLARLKSLEEFAVECAILKIHGSEVLDFVVDEGVQVYGGMGYSAEGPMDRAYRDARINRIFEGTNEINRMLIVEMLLKRSFRGHLDLMTPAREVQKELTSISERDQYDENQFFAAEKKVLQNMKKSTIMMIGLVAQKYRQKLPEEQELLMHIADMVIETYVAESVMLRVEKNDPTTSDKIEATCKKEIARVYLRGALDKLMLAAKEVIWASSEGDTQKLMLLGLKRFSKITPYNSKEARRKIAAYSIEKKEYPF